MSHTMYLRFCTLVVLVGLCGAVATAVLAQSESTSVPNDMAEATAATATGVLVADVAFSDVAATVSGSQLDVTFSLTSLLGTQDGVRYGILVQDAKTGELLDTNSRDNPVSILENTPLTGEVHYELPTYLTSEGAIFLVAYHVRGMILAITQVGEVASSVTKPAAACTRTDVGYTCLSTGDAEAVVTIMKASPLGDVLTSEKYPLRGGQEQVIATGDMLSGLPAGFHTVALTVRDAEGTVLTKKLYEHRVESTELKIGNIVPQSKIVGKKQSLELLVYLQTPTPTLGAQNVELVVESDCSETVVHPVKNFVETLSVPVTCSEGTVTTTLRSADGAVLDTLPSVFSLPRVSKPIPEEAYANLVPLNKTPIIVLGVFLVLLVLYVIYRRRQPINGMLPALLLMVSSALFFNPSAAEAATTVVWLNDTQLEVTYSISNTSVPAGSALTASGILRQLTAGTMPYLILRFIAAPCSTCSGSYLINNSVNPSSEFSTLKQVVLTSPATLGPQTVNFIVYLQKNSGGYSAGLSLPYTVTAPASVDISFE
jgi:hypothetical protein